MHEQPEPVHRTKPGQGIKSDDRLNPEFRRKPGNLKILVTGANGQLGRDLTAILGERYDVIGYGRDQLDVCDDARSREIVGDVRPDVVIHAAAYTAVDQAESEPEEAYRVNALGARNMAVAAQEFGAKLCYISTDYVFDGQTDKPYAEYDEPRPLSVYGKTKRAGEQFVQTLCRRFFIVRTSWVFGLHGANFVKTMLRLGREGQQVKVVDDQIGSPTYTVDLCRFLADLVATEKYGIYHATNTGHCSWYDFAAAIFAESGMSVRLEPCSTAEFPRPAPRPAFSALDHLAIRANGLNDFRHWREALKAFLAEFHRSS